MTHDSVFPWQPPRHGLLSGDAVQRMIATVSTETDAVGLNKAPGILIPSSFKETPSIRSLNVTHSNGLHIGTKIIADSVTYINEEHNNKKEKKLLTNNIMIIAVATLLTAILIVIIVKNKSNIDNSGKRPFSEPTTQCPIVDPTTPTSTTPEPTEEPTPTLPPDFEIIPYNDWSITRKMECFKNTNGYTISLEILNSNDCESSKDYLILYETKYSLKHNFYISGDGYVFEGYGWNCSAEYNYRYSRSVVKIAFFCLTDSSHPKILEKLISYGIIKSKLHHDYNVLPECCRNSNVAIIDNSTMAYLNSEAARSFKNPKCMDYNPQCIILYGK